MINLLNKQKSPNKYGIHVFRYTKLQYVNSILLNDQEVMINFTEWLCSAQFKTHQPHQSIVLLQLHSHDNR